MIIKLHLKPDDLKKWKAKVKESGFEGRGADTRYAEKIAREKIIFADENAKAMLKLLNLKQT